MDNQLIFRLGKHQRLVNHRLDRWETQRFAHRIWAKDPTLWYPEPQPEITDRLGWLALPERMQEKYEDILSFAHRIKGEGFSRILLLGMGGSSLAPEVFQSVMGNTKDFPELVVLDTTHPAAIDATEKKLDPSSTLILVSSKSGTTLETLSLFHYFWAWACEDHDDPGRCFVAITDEGSPLDGLAKKRKFRRTFHPSPDVGGRYSVFTEFGLVPAALIGVDIQSLLDKGRIAARAGFAPGVEKRDLGIMLGAALGELATHKNKLTFMTSPSLSGFPVWLEQLIAESTGKQERGIVPIVDEPSIPAETYSKDRAFVGFFLEEDGDQELEKHFLELEAIGHPTIRIGMKDKIDLGQEFFRWEMATACAGAALGIHPFNQPDVQTTKDLTRSAMTQHENTKEISRGPLDTISISEEKACETAVKDAFSKTSPGDYIALQAYLPPNTEVAKALQSLREAILKHSQEATTLGFGPRYLHSTGQLHKGGPNTLLAIQITDMPQSGLRVPGSGFTFDALIQAQAQADCRALQQKKRRILRISLGQDVIEGLKTLKGFFY
jgi:transaldolase/glucose-6-phosphate isomerase